MWFPASLFRSIFKKLKYNADADNFYISLGLGPGLSSIQKGKVFVGALQQVGYLIPLKNQNAIHIKVSTPAYLLKKQSSLIDDENNIYQFVNLSVGYAFK